jgi:hypothetical protein
MKPVWMMKLKRGYKKKKHRLNKQKHHNLNLYIKKVILSMSSTKIILFLILGFVFPLKDFIPILEIK